MTLLTYNDIMTKYFMTKQQPKLHRDQDPGTTQPEGNSTHLNYKFFFFFFLDTQIFPVLVVNSLCKNIFLIFFSKFPVFSLSGKMDFQIPCFPCAVATLYHITAEIRRRSGTNPEYNPQLNPSGAVGIRCGNWSASWHFSLVSPEGRSFSSQNKPDSYRGFSRSVTYL